jgi:transcriptional regulator with XRE-family HTH domain
MTAEKLQKQLGININRYRYLAGLTVEALAERAGISTGHLSDISSGRKWVSSSSLTQIADALGVPVQALFIDPDTTDAAMLATTVSALSSELQTKIDAVIQATAKDYLKRGTS